ncbi:tetratricopeptide repeat protein [Desulfosporosinus sp. Sb-LF]|uniref:tetratricopeptide repeat protein n=1 Tax=Desulfosporosinus sp. Sb-LF TaxID=2560027 RepID=UPI00107FADDB|nr:tetratricopeptide repeat protein [Desulfosporosinus sp. Sb-LF]TGE32361.1 tetratricopeptide repeat protein [Desulfosporosinus sp. Sb-LF]
MYDEELSAWRNLMESGTQCLGEEQYLKAEKYYMLGVLKAYQLSVPEIIAFTLRLLATVRVRLGNLEFAKEGFKEALSICEEIQNTKGMAEAWAGLASVSVKKGMFKDASWEYERSISVYPSSSPQLRLSMLYADLGQVYAALKDWTSAKSAYIKARELCRLHGFPKGEGELDVLLGELCFRQGEETDALINLKHACQVFAQINDMISLSNTLQYLALLYFDQDEIQLAFNCQQRAVALCIKFNTINVFSESCYFLGKIEQFLENYEEAKYYLGLSIRFYPEYDLDLALRYQSLAGIFFLCMDLDKAETNYLIALDFYEKVGDDLRAGEVFEALAALREIRERKKGPMKVHNELEKYHQSEFALEALVRLAELYEKKRNFREALEYYWKALEMGRDAELTTDWIESRVQRVSKRLRRKS